MKRLKRVSKCIVLPVLLLFGVTLNATTLYAARPPRPDLSVLPHADKITSYAGPETCFKCHPSSIADDIFTSVHFQVRAVNADMDMPGGGSHGMLDRACGLPGTTLLANNWAGTAVSPVNSSLTRDDGCGKCHIAYKPPFMYPDAASASPDLDCLRCHALVYGEEWTHSENITLYGANDGLQLRKVITLADGSKIWSQDRSLKTAQSVTLPSTEACLRCHEHGLSGYKRATPFTADDDVHANKKMDCVDCHTTINHKIARGNYVTDGMASDLPEVEVECTNCHSATAPHSVNFVEELNRHVTNVMCEACHVHKMEKTDRNIYRRAWAPYTMDPSYATPVWENTQPTTRGLEYPDFWDAYTEYLPLNVWPEIRWFNGQASMLAQPYGSYAERRSAGGDARLFSFKPFVSGMLFDGGWLSNTPDPISGTRMFSTKWFYEQNWNTFLAMGMIDSSYKTADEYWTARPDMAKMLEDFPMMLNFSRPIYMEEAGTVLGSPVPGPQTAATYPGIAKAISNGMGTMAITMGYFPPETDPEAAGVNMWSGQFFGMWVPVNMDQDSPFFMEVTSFITMSHAITSNVGSTVESCYACHFTADEYNGVSTPADKYLSYSNLGYPDLDANGLIDPMYDKVVTFFVAQDSSSNVLPIVDSAITPDTTINSVGNGSNGGKIINHTTYLEYAPSPGFVGTETFTYTCKCSKGYIMTATAEVEVSPSMGACTSCHTDKTALLDCGNKNWRKHSRLRFVDQATFEQAESNNLGARCSDTAIDYTILRKDMNRKK